MHLVERVVDSVSGVSERFPKKMKAKQSFIKQTQIFQVDKGIGYSREREQNGQGVRNETNTGVEWNRDGHTLAMLRGLESARQRMESHIQSCISRTDTHLKPLPCLLCPVHLIRFPFLSASSPSKAQRRQLEKRRWLTGQSFPSHIQNFLHCPRHHTWTNSIL